MTTAQANYGTWHADRDREVAMADGHRPYWKHFIGLVPETDLADKDVLDFGCNRGGFLQLLHATRPFRSGLGVDIATESIAAAEAAKGDMPVEHRVATNLAPWAGRFDIAFSYEVIYLLPDIADHAAQIFRSLRPGGVYYAVTGCHTDSPLWPRWRTLIAGITNAPVQDRSPDDYAAAFLAAGFSVSLKKFGFDGFVPAPKDPRYYPRLIDALTYGADDKLLFRLVKP
jgi:SAM-dependent methyltransferase